MGVCLRNAGDGGAPDSPLLHTVARGDYQMLTLEHRISHVLKPPNDYTTLGAVEQVVINGDQLS